MKSKTKELLSIDDEINKAVKRANFVSSLPITVEDIIIRYPYVMVSVQHSWVNGIGFAKCCPKDKKVYEENIGVKIALARAVRDIVKNLKKKTSMD